MFGSGPRGLPEGIDTIIATVFGSAETAIIDIVNDPAGHDLLDDAVLTAFCADIRRHRWHAVWIAAVCTSFSRALRPAVRGDGDALWGLPASRLPRVVGGTSGV